MEIARALSYPGICCPKYRADDYPRMNQSSQPQRAVIWGFVDEASKIIDHLRNSEVVEIVHWFGDSTGATTSIRKFRKEPFIEQDVHWRTYSDTAARLDQIAFLTFQDMFLRTSKGFTVRYSPSFHELRDLFHLYNHIFSDLIDQNKIDIVMFSNLPHEGPEIILYMIAKDRGIPTLITAQSQFPNHYFYLYDVYDYGDMAHYPELHADVRFELQRRHEKELFYMKDIPGLQSRVNKTHTPSILRVLYRVMYRMLRGQGACGLRAIMLKAYDEVDAWNRYSEQLKQNVAYSCNLREAFVYFPLHLQPELSTSALGGVFTDQILAIEILRTILPKQWYIYVKENPKQSPYARGDYFFKRLARIPRVRLVPYHMNTYELIRKSKFVATVSGTAGWEGISGGKPALVFGNAWYRKLPGVWEYRAGLRGEEIAETSWEHNELKRAVEGLLKRLPRGLVDWNYRAMVPDVSAEENAERVALFLKSQILRG